MNIILVEDDPIWSMQIKSLLLKLQPNCNLSVYSSTKNAAKALKEQQFDVGFFDLYINSPIPNGTELLNIARDKSIPSFILSSSEDTDNIRICHQKKASAFISKNHQGCQFEKALSYAIKKSQSTKNQKVIFNSYVTLNSALKKQITCLVDHPEFFDLGIFLKGPSGSGKSYLASTLANTVFPEQKLFHLNLAELPPQLIESELFGHVKGSFTGAIQDKKGLFELANNGILFLDEISCIPKDIQVKLLKVLEDGTFKPIGGHQFRKSKFTLISASCDNMREMIQDKTFREDLYFRISGHEVEIPSLQNRPEDIQALYQQFLKDCPVRIPHDQDIVEELKKFDWPGNIRELKNTIFKIIYSYNTEFKFDAFLRQRIPKTDVTNNPVIKNTDIAYLDSSMFIEKLEKEIETKGLSETIQIIEKNIVLKLWNQTNGKVNEICRKLKISKSIFYRIKSELIAENLISEV